MTDWNRAKKLIQKAFESGYFRMCYGELIATNTGNHHTPYPFTQEETKFLFEYFGGKYE